MEFVRVSFPTLRTVRVDNAARGSTGDVLRLQAGHHTFDLGPDGGYTPPNQTVRLIGTSLGAPMELEFFPVRRSVKRATKRAPARKRATKKTAVRKRPARKPAAKRPRPAASLRKTAKKRPAKKAALVVAQLRIRK